MGAHLAMAIGLQYSTNNQEMCGMAALQGCVCMFVCMCASAEERRIYPSLCICMHGEKREREIQGGKRQGKDKGKEQIRQGDLSDVFFAEKPFEVF